VTAEPLGESLEIELVRFVKPHNESMGLRCVRGEPCAVDGWEGICGSESRAFVAVDEGITHTFDPWWTGLQSDLKSADSSASNPSAAFIPPFAFRGRQAFRAVSI
jgi:hypothetical protein